MSSPNFSLKMLIEKALKKKRELHKKQRKQKKKKETKCGVTKLNIVCRRNSSTDYRVSSK